MVRAVPPLVTVDAMNSPSREPDSAAPDHDPADASAGTSLRQPRADNSGLDRVYRWEGLLAWPLFFGAVILFALTTLLLADDELSAPIVALCSTAIGLLWVWFVVDYLVRLAVARGARWEFVRTRLFDLVTLLVPPLRPFLLLIYIWRLPVFRVQTGRRQRARYMITMILFAFMFVYTVSLGVWLVERHAPNASIHSFDDALWWGFTTISTVGYGDFVPVTALGRLLAVGLMIGGIAVIGVTSATVVSAITDQLRAAAAHAHSHPVHHGEHASHRPSDHRHSATPSAPPG